MKTYKYILAIMLGLTVSSMIVSCSEDDGGGESDRGGDKEISDDTNRNSNIALESTNTDVMRLEVPKIRQGQGIYFRSHWATKNNSSSDKVMNYCYEYDASVYHTRWVAFSFDKLTIKVHASRSDQWGEDLSLPSNERLAYTSYSGSGYNRGHLCASQDRVFSTQANAQTFYMSNMSPQMGDFNAYYWAELESIIRKWAYNTDKFKTLYVCKGGTIRADQLKGKIFTTNSKGNPASVAIPKYYFMAILGETQSDTYQSIGFWMEHKDYGYHNTYPPATVMQKHVVSIDELEGLTGIDFFCNLNDKLENNVEKGCNVDAWSWK